MLNLLKAIEALKKELDIPATIVEMVGEAKEAEYQASIVSMAEAAWDDQNTGVWERGGGGGTGLHGACDTST